MLINPNASLTVTLNDASTVYLLMTVSSVAATKTFAIAYGGSATNASIKASVNPIVTGADITYTVGDTSGNYNKIIITNKNINYGTYFRIISLGSGTYTIA